MLGGRIDLDPSSSAFFNDVVRAKRIITMYQDCRVTPWGRIGDQLTAMVNPYDTITRETWRLLMANWYFGVISKAVWVGFRIEQLRTLQGVANHNPLDFQLCVPRSRPKYYDPRGITRNDPRTAGFLCFIGIDRELVRDTFTELGAVTP